MSHHPHNTLDSGSQFNAVVAAFLQAVVAGEAPDRKGLLSDNPDLADQLRLFFDDHDWMAGLAPAVEESASIGSTDKDNDRVLK